MKQKNYAAILLILCIGFSMPSFGQFSSGFCGYQVLGTNSYNICLDIEGASPCSPLGGFIQADLKISSGFGNTISATQVQELNDEPDRWFKLNDEQTYSVKITFTLPSGQTGNIKDEVFVDFGNGQTYWLDIDWYAGPAANTHLAQSTFTFTTGNPAFEALHNSDLLTITYYYNNGNVYMQAATKTVIEGDYIESQDSWTTTTPQLPQFILRDPPGDGSHSFIEEETQICRGHGMSLAVDASANAYGSVKLGVKGSVGLVVQTDYEAYAEFSSSLEMGVNRTSSTQYEMCLTTNSRFSTDDSNAELTGSKGDVYIGSATLYQYGILHKVTFDSDCNYPVYTKDLVFAPINTASTFMYTEEHIRNTLMVNLESIINANPQTNSEAAVQQAHDQWEVWNQLLNLNDDITTTAAYDNTNSFSGGTSQEYSQSVSTSVVGAVDMNLYIEASVGVEMGVEVGGSGGTLGASVRARTDMGSSSSSSNANTNTVGYTLADDDVGDQFNVGVYKDPVFGTPVFKLAAGSESSCPYEGGYQLDQPMLQFTNGASTADLPVVGVGQDGSFNLEICNDSNQDRTYYLKVVNETNGSGLIIEGFGENLSSDALGADLTIPAQGCLETAIITFRQTNTNIQAYEGVQLRLYSLCQEDGDPIESFVTFNANFVTPPDNDSACDAANIPTNGVVQNGYSNTDASVADDEQQLAPTVGDCYASWCPQDLQVQNSVWFSFTAPESGYVAISTVHEGTDFDTQLALYEATDCNNFNNFNLLAANDDAPNDSQYRSFIEYTGLTSGTTYYILVDGYAGDIGSISISISGEDPNADDDGDGVPNTEDLCEGSDDNIESDGDGMPDDCDECPDLGRIGLAFDGSNDYLDGVELNNFNPTTNTIEMWLYLEAYPVNNRSWPLFLGSWGSGQHWIINTDGSAHIGAFNVAALNPILPLQEWVHIATTYDGSTYALYVNGVLFDAITLAFSYPSPNLTIGGLGFGSDEYHNGKMDEVRIWNTTRTPSEIVESMNRELAGTESGLVAYYNFAEGLPNGDNQCVALAKDKTGVYDLAMNSFEKSGNSSNWAAGAPVLLRFENDNDEGNACFLERNLGFEGIAIDTLYTTTEAVSLDLPLVTPDNGQYSGDFVNGNTFDVAQAGAGVFEATYTIVDDISGCILSDDVVIVVELINATYDPAFSSSLNIWPNPTRDYVTIEFDYDLDEAMHVSLWTPSGKLLQNVMLEDTASGNHEISLAPLPNGMYYLNFKSLSGEILGQRRIVKQ